MKKTRELVRQLKVLLAFVTLLFATAARVFAQDDEQTLQQVYNNQHANWSKGMADPEAANSRVRSIWVELVRYSKRQFAVYPSQTFTAGHATFGGIYLDISIAADPSVDVTRFFLAHEWGHMIHGDPVSQLSAIGQYQMVMGGSAVEDNADAYAATFMRYQHHDIKPILDFFCALPTVPGDTHSSGPDRAKHVARLYGLQDPPCDDGNTNVVDVLQAEISKMAEASRQRFASVKGTSSGVPQHYLSIVKLSLQGKDRDCEFSLDPDEDAACNYVFSVHDQSQVDAEYEMLLSATDAAVPKWLGREETHDTSQYPNLPRREHTWLAKVNDAQPRIDLELCKSSINGDEFLSITFVAPDN